MNFVSTRSLLIPLIVFLGSGQTVMAVEGQSDNIVEPAPLPLEQIQRFSDVFEKIKQGYVEPVTDEELLDDAIRGMLAGLDPHSIYLDASHYENFQVDTDGQFGGLGIEIQVEDKLLKVISPIDDTPASRAGILAGDIIVEIDGTKTFGLPQDETIDLLRGEVGSKVELKIIRQGEKKPVKVTLKRAIINIASVKSQLLDNTYGYIRIAQFQRETGLSLRKSIAKLKQEAGENLEGLVLDLRNNPGGILDGAIDVSNSFLSTGDIVSTRGRDSDVVNNFKASAPDLLEGIPMVVLVNGGSASAAEIVAGALQDHKRAVIMGTRTFGKGSVQTIFPLSGRAAIKFTTARYYTPNDRSIQAEGIQPDIRVEQRAQTDTESAESGVRETDLPGHLENEAQVETQESDNGIKGDYQLNEALKLLKGINIAGSGMNVKG